jgi:hypothetical protein
VTDPVTDQEKIHIFLIFIPKSEKPCKRLFIRASCEIGKAIIRCLVSGVWFQVSGRKHERRTIISNKDRRPELQAQ